MNQYTSLTDATDEDLVKQARAGDKEAFNVLCERYLAAIYNRLRMKLPPEEVEDVTQEVFLAATKSIKRFKGDASFYTWLSNIAQYKIADFYRRRGRKPELTELDPEANINSEASDWKESVAVRLALEQLPHHYQEIILLRFNEGLHFEQIAKTLRISLEAAKSRYRRAVAALAEGLQVD